MLRKKIILHATPLKVDYRHLDDEVTTATGDLCSVEAVSSSGREPSFSMLELWGSDWDRYKYNMAISFLFHSIFNNIS